ncbi:hypothetical protein ABKN59_007244 [Abortiporus biennis]
MFDSRKSPSDSFSQLPPQLPHSAIYTPVPSKADTTKTIIIDLDNVDANMTYSSVPVGYSASLRFVQPQASSSRCRYLHRSTLSSEQQGRHINEPVHAYEYNVLPRNSTRGQDTSLLLRDACYLNSHRQHLPEPVQGISSAAEGHLPTTGFYSSPAQGPYEPNVETSSHVYRESSVPPVPAPCPPQPTTLSLPPSTPGYHPQMGLEDHAGATYLADDGLAYTYEASQWAINNEELLSPAPGPQTPALNGPINEFWQQSPIASDILPAINVPIQPNVSGELMGLGERAERCGGEMVERFRTALSRHSCIPILETRCANLRNAFHNLRQLLLYPPSGFEHLVHDEESNLNRYKKVAKSLDRNLERFESMRNSSLTSLIIYIFKWSTPIIAFAWWALTGRWKLYAKRFAMRELLNGLVEHNTRRKCKTEKNITMESGSSIIVRQPLVGIFGNRLRNVV